MSIGKLGHALGMAVRAGGRTKLGRKKPFKYHFVKGSSQFEDVSSYGEPVLGSRSFSYVFKSRKTPKDKLNLRFKRSINKRLSGKYTEFGIGIDKVKTVSASKRRAVKRYKKTVHKSPSYKTRAKGMYEHLEDRIESLGPDYPW
jgi:RNase P protein component